MKEVEQTAWDRQPHESSKAYTHATLYFQMGAGRSLRKMLKESTCVSKIAQLRRWSVRWNWVDRAQQYDDHLIREERIENESARKDMLKRHAKLATQALDIVKAEVFRRLKTIINAQNEGHDPPEKLDPSDMTRLLDIAVKVERISRGESSEGRDVNDPLSQLLDEFRQQYAATPKDEAAADNPTPIPSEAPQPTP